MKFFAKWIEFNKKHALDPDQLRVFQHFSYVHILVPAGPGWDAAIEKYEMSTIVTTKEVGQFFKLTETTIYKLCLSGDLPGFKIGRSWRFDMEEIFEMINRQIEQKKNRVSTGESDGFK